MIADNRLTENAEWDERLLAEQLRDLSLLNLDFSLEVTGFEIGEIDLRIESLGDGSEGRDAADELLPAGNGPAVTRTGDLWLLRSNKILLGEMLSAGGSAYTELKNLCVWAKDSAGMGALYRSAHELVLVFKNGKEPHRNNILLGRYGGDRTNVWKYAGAAALRRSDEGNLLAQHSTPKPVAMVADALMDVSARGEIVLDSFLGIGTTVIAAERTGRRCYGIEIDPLYTDIAVRRWQAWTRDRARHAVSGLAFDEISAERGGNHAN